MKYALADADVDVAIGENDFSFNEIRKGKCQAFWSAHLYVITIAKKKKQVKREVSRWFPGSVMTPGPIKVSQFQNTAYRRSYALKTEFLRKIGYDQTKKCEDRVRKCRNTSRDKLRAGESLELLLFPDQIGLACFFLGVHQAGHHSGTRHSKLAQNNGSRICGEIAPGNRGSANSLSVRGKIRM